MENTEVKLELTPEQQLAELGRQQQKLQQQIDQARSDNVAKQMNALSAKAQARIDAEEQEALVLAEIRKNRQQREAEAQREAEVIAEASRKVAEERFAQQLLEKNARIQAEVTVQHLRDETEKAHRLERELERQLLDLHTDNTVVTEVAKPTEIPSPLARILFPDAANAQSTVYEGMSSVENAKLVAKRDAVENLLEFGKSKATFATNQPAPVTVAVGEPRKKAKPSVDWSSATELENLLWSELKIRGNPQSIEKLASVYESVWLIQCARRAIAQFKAKPMSWDGLLITIEQLADEPVAAQGTAQPDATCGGGN